jgi:hypothetical protein
MASNYPLAPATTYITVSPAPETRTQRTGDPYLGGTDPDAPRVKSMQPGFNQQSIPVMCLTG